MSFLAQQQKMDTDSVEKWKMEFENERKDQLTKAKELQKETMQRRKAMEMKANLEIAKEEKRRQEALAERRAAHVEATMRFQKGIKHFKMNKEKISLEEVLKKINPSRSRLNSADDKVIIYNNDLASYYCVSKHKQSGPVKLRKSNSYDNLTKYVNKYETPAIHNKTPNNFNIIDHYNNTNNYSQIPVSNLYTNNFSSNQNGTHQNSNNNTNITSNNTQIFASNLNNTTNSTTNNTKSTRPPNFKDMLIENQKTIQDINKEALKEFQSLVSNELKKTISPNLAHTDIQLTHQHTNNNFVNNINSNKLEQPVAKKDAGIKVENENNDDDDDESDDSMDTDSLLDDNLEQENPTLTTATKSTSNKINGENDDDSNMMNSNSNFNLVKRFNFNQRADDDDEDDYDDEDKNYNNNNSNTQYGIDPFTFLTNTTNNLTSLLSNHKNFFVSSPGTPLTTNNGIEQHQQQQQRQVNANILRNNTNKQIKSILKRSSSLDNTINMIGLESANNVAIKQAAVNFGIRPPTDKNTVKDSLELANNRIVNKKDVSDDKRDKKSVRFAAKISEDDSSMNKQSSLTVNQIYENQIAIKPKEIEPIPTANLAISRISSTNSIRRPIVKPRNTTLKNKIPNEQPSISNENTLDTVSQKNISNAVNMNKIADENVLNLKLTKESEKPPIYPGTITANNILSTGGYAVLSQKRKEYLQRTKQNGAIITSPKTTPMSPTSLILPASNANNTDQVHSQPNINHNNLTQLNRAQLNNSPLQFYSTNNQTQINKPPPATKINTITTPLHSPNVDSNYTNLKYNENSFREYQAAKLNDFNSTNGVLNNNTKFKPNLTDPNLYRCNPINSNLNATENNQYNLSKIPLSPKSTLLKTNSYFNVVDKQTTLNANGMEQISIKRPFATNGLVSNTNQIISSPSNFEPTTYSAFNATGAINGTSQAGPKTNFKFSYLNNNNNISNTISNLNNINQQLTNIQLAHQSQNNIQRTVSADTINRSFKPPNNSPTLHLEIKYPLYSNYQQVPTQYINISKPIRPTSGHDANNEVVDSMAAFLKAEEMATKECTESQIMGELHKVQNIMHEMQNGNGRQIKTIPVNLSIEEQNVKNSIMRLNEKLNNLSNYNNNRRYSNQEEQLARQNYEAFNRYKKPISASVLKNRR